MRTDCEGDFNKDKGKFDPERGTQDSVLAVVYPESLVFGANEDCRDDVTDAAGGGQ